MPNNPERIGELIGMAVAPFFFAWLLFFIYEKITKKHVAGKTLKIVLLGVILLLASAAGRLGV